MLCFVCKGWALNRQALNIKKFAAEDTHSDDLSLLWLNRHRKFEGFHTKSLRLVFLSAVSASSSAMEPSTAAVKSAEASTTMETATAVKPTKPTTARATP